MPTSQNITGPRPSTVPPEVASAIDQLAAASTNIGAALLRASQAQRANASCAAELNAARCAALQAEQHIQLAIAELSEALAELVR